jgi:hypothetical protein
MRAKATRYPSASGATHRAFAAVFQMRISGGLGEEVEFASTLESEEARAAVSLLDCRQPRNEEFVRMCSWCQRVNANWPMDGGRGSRRHARPDVRSHRSRDYPRHLRRLQE